MPSWHQYQSLSIPNLHILQPPRAIHLQVQLVTLVSVRQYTKSQLETHFTKLEFLQLAGKVKKKTHRNVFVNRHASEAHLHHDSNNYMYTFCNHTWERYRVW